VNFIADENIDSIIVEVLRSNGHQVRYIAEFDRGVDDDQVFQSANSSDEILITSDKDFGEIVYRQKRTTSGVVLIRLSGLIPETKANTVLTVVQEHGEELQGNFTVITPGVVRIRRSIP
jgi:predicted nuclease of predicted toxin-antitoxin system